MATVCTNLPRFVYCLFPIEYQRIVFSAELVNQRDTWYVAWSITDVKHVRKRNISVVVWHLVINCIRGLVAFLSGDSLINQEEVPGLFGKADDGLRTRDDAILVIVKLTRPDLIE